MTVNDLLRFMELKTDRVVLVLERDLAERFAKELGGPSDWSEWLLLGTPVKVGMRTSYLVQDSWHGPLIHML